MTRIESELRALGADIDFPETPPLAATVARRIRRRRRLQRALVGLAAAVAVLAVAFAVPAARSALLRFFHLRGVTVERVEALPAARARPFERSLGERVPLAAAEQRVGFHLLLPAGTQPASVAVLDGMASVLLERARQPLVLSEFRTDSVYLLKKVVGPSTYVEPLDVDGAPGLWINGETHFLYLRNGADVAETPLSVHGNVLLWSRNGVVLRLQGALGRRDALALAVRMR